MRSTQKLGDGSKSSLWPQYGTTTWMCHSMGWAQHEHPPLLMHRWKRRLQMGVALFSPVMELGQADKIVKFSTCYAREWPPGSTGLQEETDAFGIWWECPSNHST